MPFTLAQFHYHDPSEHTVNGRAYSLEEHFVNASATGGQVVLGVFFRLGGPTTPRSDPILNAMTSSLTTPNSKTTIATPIDFAGLLPTNTQGWFYEGSLTTPPLSGPITFFEYATPIKLDFAQLKAYEADGRRLGLPPERPSAPASGRPRAERDRQ